MTTGTRQTKAAPGKERGVTPAAAASLAALAAAFSRFAEWLSLAGVRGGGGKHWRVFPSGELRGRFSTVEAAFSRAQPSIPPAARELLVHVSKGIRSSTRDEGDGVSLGVAFLDDIRRAAELLKFHCREDLGLRGPEFSTAGLCGCGCRGAAALTVSDEL